jgi:hypothetical protein
MRDPNALYDPNLNDPDPDQEDAARAIFDFVQALRAAAASEGGLDAGKVFQIAISQAPSAALKVVDLVRGGDPLQSDIESVAHVVTRQLGVYDAPEIV